MTSTATRFAVVSAVRSAAHQLADFWVQRPQHAVEKGQPGAAGAVPCALHVPPHRVKRTFVVTELPEPPARTERPDPADLPAPGPPAPGAGGADRLT